ncbi:unnamed protein product, partial [Prorocentrum cordatum]
MDVDGLADHGADGAADVDGAMGVDGADRGSPLLFQLVPWSPIDRRRLWYPTVREASSMEGPLRGFAIAPLRRSFDVISLRPRDDGPRYHCEATATVADNVLDIERPPKIVSRAAGSMIVGGDRRRHGETVEMIASCLVHCDRCALQLLNESIRRDAASLLLFVEFSRYDATELNVGLKRYDADSAVPLLDATSNTEALMDIAPDLALSKELESATLAKDGQTPNRAHLFGSEHGWAALISIKDGERRRLVNFFGPTLTWTQVVDRGTAKCAKQALIETCGTFIDADHYDTRLRIATTDAASANYMTERGMMADRENGWVNMHMPCNVHKVATGHTKTYDLVKDDITGAIQLSLSVSSASAMSSFRRAFTTVARKRLVVERGRPTALDEEYRETMLNLFLTKGQKHGEKAHMAKTILNGPWQNHSKFVVYIDGEGPIPAKVRRQVEKNVVRCLNFVCLGKSFSTYPRHRWTGADVSINEIGLAACIYGLLFPACQLFVKSAAGPSDGMHEGDRAADSRPADRRPRAGGGPRSASPAGGEVPMGAAAAQNETDKKNTLKWVETEPLHKLMAIRVTMEPWRELMEAYLFSAGEDWELRQRCAEAAHQLDPQTSDRRQFRLSTYAGLVYEKEFFEDLDKAWDSRMWDFIPLQSRTFAFRSVCFRMLSRSGCLVNHYLVKPADEFPVALFALILGVDCAKQLQDQPRCLRNVFSDHILESYPGDALGNEECIAKLITVAQITHVENVKCEHDHSSFKRHVDAQSVNTNRANFDYVNAQVMCQKFRQLMASKNKKLDASTDILDAWDAQHGADRLRNLIELGPTLAPCQPALQPLPSSGLETYEVMFDLSKKASDIASFVMGNRRSSNLGCILKRDWAKKNRLIKHDDQPQWKEPERRSECNKKCRGYGYCVCSEDGKLVASLRNSVISALKRICPRKSANVQLLKDACLVLRLQGVKPPQSAWLDSALADDDGGPPEPEFHELLQEPVDGETPYVWLRAPRRYFYGWALFSNLDRLCSWTCSLYRLVDTCEHTGLFDVTLVPVEALPLPDGEVDVWP